MRFVLLLAGLLCLGTDAFALLGDTRERADERYGVARSESPEIRDRALVEGAHHAIYHFEGFEIYCAFLKATDGRSYSVRERYQRLSPPPSVQPQPSPYLEDFEVNALLTTQGGGSAWRKSDRTSLSDLAPKWLGERLWLNQSGTLWTRRDGALAHAGHGNISITFSHPQSLIHESQLEHGTAASGREATEQFIASIVEAHQAFGAQIVRQEAPAAPVTYATIPEGRPPAPAQPPRGNIPAPQPTPATTADARSVQNALVKQGVFWVLVIGVVRLVVAGLKSGSRRGRKRSPLRQKPASRRLRHSELSLTKSLPLTARVRSPPQCGAGPLAFPAGDLLSLHQVILPVQALRRTSSASSPAPPYRVLPQ